MKKTIVTIAILTASMSANATYCSLETPQYCPPQQGGGANTANGGNANANAGAIAGAHNSNQIGIRTDVQSNSSAQVSVVSTNESNNLNDNSNAVTAGGGSSNVTVNGGNTSYRQVRQAPMAYAPTPMIGASAYNCANSTTFGASSPFGGISMGLPLTEDNCPIFVMSEYLYAHGQPREGCEVLNQIEQIKDVRQKTGFTCVPPVARVQPAAYVPPKFIDPDQDYKLNSVFKNNMMK